MTPTSSNRTTAFASLLAGWAQDSSDDEDDAFHERLIAFIKVDPTDALDRGKRLMVSHDAIEQELGVLVIGVSAELDRDLIPRAVPDLRATLDGDFSPGSIATAVAKLGHLGDSESSSAIVALAGHSDPEVRS